MSKSWKYTLTLVALFSLLGLSCSSPAGASAVTDDLGREVKMASTPQRIVSLSPSNTEILFALGLGDRVVGVDDFSDYPEQAKSKTKVGGLHKPSLEKIVSLNPDLVLAMGEYPEFVGQLEAQGLTVVALEPEDLQGVLNNIQLVGKVTGTTKQAQKLVQQMEEERDAVVKKVATAPRPRVLYEIDGSDPARPWVAGPGSFIDNLITVAGGENAASRARERWAQVSLEEIVAADPQIIVLGDAMFGETPEKVKSRPGWQGIAAVKAAKLYPLNNVDLVNKPGPRIMQGLAELARILHPDLFPAK